jgi:phosphatidylglycerophosphatase A
MGYVLSSGNSIQQPVNGSYWRLVSKLTVGPGQGFESCHNPGRIGWGPSVESEDLALPGRARGVGASEDQHLVLPHGPPHFNMLNRWACILATGLGCGYVPVAPGTVGSLVGVLFYLVFNSLSSFWVNVFFLVCLFAMGVYVSGMAEEIFQETDAKAIVIDEIHGMFLTLLLLPEPSYMVAAFVLFRGFDILKPFPARLVEQKMRGGFAIMMDDVVAAGYAILILHVFDRFIR